MEIFKRCRCWLTVFMVLGLAGAVAWYVLFHMQSPEIGPDDVLVRQESCEPDQKMQEHSIAEHNKPGAI